MVSTHSEYKFENTQDQFSLKALIGDINSDTSTYPYSIYVLYKPEFPPFVFFQEYSIIKNFLPWCCEDSDCSLGEFCENFFCFTKHKFELFLSWTGLADLDIDIINPD
jgi:hypothetical protein